jgi:hypothetical protein
MSCFVTGALSAVREANEINFAIASGRPPRRASIAANLFSASGLKLPALPCMFSTPAGPLGSGRALWLMHQRLRLDCSCHSGTHMCRQEFPGQKSDAVHPNARICETPSKPGKLDVSRIPFSAAPSQNRYLSPRSQCCCRRRACPGF